MTTDVKLLPDPKLPTVLERFVLSSLSQFKAEGVRHELRKMLHDYARANMEALIAENERLRAKYQRAAESSEHFAARAERLAEALRKAREDINWMLNSRQFLNSFVFDYIDAALDQEGGNG